MEYLYSSVVDPSTYETEGLCDGIAVRQNNFTSFEDRGAIRAHQDWNKHISPCYQYRGTLGPDYSFLSVAIPECIPERLEVLSFANELAFLHDDVTEHIDNEEREIENDDMMAAFLQGAKGGSIDTNSPDTKRGGKKRLQSQMFLEMLEIDRECALVTLKSWARFLEVGSSRQHSTRFTSMKDYLPYRIMDVGEMFWYGLVTFALKLHIPEHELETCRKLLSPAWITVGLQNDLFSWPKERDSAKKRGASHVVNAIWVLMKEQNCDAGEAMNICRKLIKSYVAEYVQIVKDNRNNYSLSIDLRKYAEAMLYSISGNVVWSLNCPRYNNHVSFNKIQLDWMLNGIPVEDSTTSFSSRSSDVSQDGSEPSVSSATSICSEQNGSWRSSLTTETNTHPPAKAGKSESSADAKDEDRELDGDPASKKAKIEVAVPGPKMEIKVNVPAVLSNNIDALSRR